MARQLVSRRVTNSKEQKNYNYKNIYIYICNHIFTIMIRSSLRLLPLARRVTIILLWFFKIYQRKNKIEKHFFFFTPNYFDFLNGNSIPYEACTYRASIWVLIYMYFRSHPHIHSFISIRHKLKVPRLIHDP